METTIYDVFDCRRFKECTKMIINMPEFNTDDVHDWSFYSLEAFRDMLSSNTNLYFGETESQRLKLKVIMVEDDGQNRIKCIKLGA